MGEAGLFSHASKPTPVPSAEATTPRGRVRDVLPGVYLGSYQPGPKNGITDVPGVLVHTTTIRQGNGAINTGLTTIVPRKEWLHKACYAATFRFNGAGELTGSHWINETGLLHVPIIITNTFAVGQCHTGVFKFAVENYERGDDGVNWFILPVVAETWDGVLNDVRHPVITPDHVVEGITKASAEPVPEGNVGGGTGMICQGFKGGTGTSSRLVSTLSGDSYTVGVLVQANYGRKPTFHMGGVPIGRILTEQAKRNAEEAAKQAEYDAYKDAVDGSIIIIVATDAPLHPTQLQRLAKRAATGLARVGGNGHNTSGDIFLAFSTANEIPVLVSKENPFKVRELDVSVTDDTHINGLLEATADATEEAIYNAVCMAETMTGFKGRTVEALPIDRVRKIVGKFKEVEDAFLQ